MRLKEVWPKLKSTSMRTKEEKHCFFKTWLQEFPSWLSGQGSQLVPMRMRVRSRASLSGLRIWRRHELQCRSQMQLRSALSWLWCRPAIAALSTPGLGPKKHSKKQKNQTRLRLGTVTRFSVKSLGERAQIGQVIRASHLHTC